MKVAWFWVLRQILVSPSHPYLVVCCLWFVVCCWLFVPCCLLFVRCCLLFVVCWLLFVVCCVLCGVCCVLFVVCCLMLVVGCWLLVVYPVSLDGLDHSILWVSTCKHVISAGCGFINGNHQMPPSPALTSWIDSWSSFEVKKAWTTCNSEEPTTLRCKGQGMIALG